ncbi:hypothetical protein GCM10010472_21360 [Pseudonocardia halophobica]|uniref:UspA domain-containing protein n=1 Tax=Pseudonocardia halophobica TaxID=29401 RepID=A0A9W6KX84_9PSEU|nr:universal stress protein [Pseudonocardia halophobica]GLL09368.1 hypothetical protein GCM10017577_05080 [Pseudonocardia halophobica]
MTTTVVVGVDSSAESQSALRWAACYAELTGGTLRAVTAWEPAVQPVGPGRIMSPATDLVPPQDLHEVAARLLDETVNDTLGPDHSHRLEKHVMPGDPAEVLLDRSDGAAVLVLGNGHHGALAGALRGLGVLHCLHRADCPVVLVPAASGPD